MKTRGKNRVNPKRRKSKKKELLYLAAGGRPMEILESGEVRLR